MEPADLKSPPPDDHQLEAWLRANAASAPLPDAGFSARVLAALPPEAPVVTHRMVLCLVGTAAGVAFAAAQGASLTGLSTGWSELEPALGHTLRALAEPSVLLALAVTAGSLLFVFGRGQLEEVFE